MAADRANQISPEKKNDVAASARMLFTLLEKNISARDIMTRKAFENGLTVAWALGGSTNALDLDHPSTARDLLDAGLIEVVEQGLIEHLVSIEHDGFLLLLRKWRISCHAEEIRLVAAPHVGPRAFHLSWLQYPFKC